MVDLPLLLWTVALLVIASAPSIALSQSTATVSGTVRDASGLVVPGAMLELRNLDTGATDAQMANEQGEFLFSAVAPGRYEVTIGANRFRETTFPLTVDAAGAYRMDRSLERFFALERIVVTATRTPQAIGNVAAAVSVVSEDEIQEGEN